MNIYNPLGLKETWADYVADSKLAALIRKYLMCACIGLCVAGLAI